MPPVRLEGDGGVAELVLDAPPLNLFDAGVLDALEDALGAVEAAAPPASRTSPSPRSPSPTASASPPGSS